MYRGLDISLDPWYKSIGVSPVAAPVHERETMTTTRMTDQIDSTLTALATLLDDAYEGDAPPHEVVAVGLFLRPYIHALGTSEQIARLSSLRGRAARLRDRR